MKIAIVVVTYNRLECLKRLVASLQAAVYNEEVSLIISIDKSDTDIVENYSEALVWPYGKKIIDKHENNLGLRNHMMSLGKWFDLYDAIVVLEDDIVVSKGFYEYTQQAVEKYYGNMQISGISLYTNHIMYLNNTPFIPVNNGFDAYLMNTAVSWGQVWMKPQWEDFYQWYLSHQDFSYNPLLPQNLYGWTKSWLKYHIRYSIENNKYFVIPYVALSTNCGDKGVHSPKSNILFQVPLLHGFNKKYYLPNIENAIHYDGHYEWKGLYDILNINEDELTIRLNTHTEKQSRYLLCTDVLNYKIIKSFGLLYRPIEMNVLNNVEGNEIFLYDTSISATNKTKGTKNSILLKYYLHDSISFIMDYGIKYVFIDFVSRFCSKIKMKGKC